jgi:hypothetical protein
MAYRGCKPEPQKFPSCQFQSRHEHISVDELAARSAQSGRGIAGGRADRVPDACNRLSQDTMSMNEFRRLAAKIDQDMQQLAAQGVSEAHAIINRS